MVGATGGLTFNVYPLVLLLLKSIIRNAPPLSATCQLQGKELYKTVQVKAGIGYTSDAVSSRYEGTVVVNLCDCQ